MNADSLFGPLDRVRRAGFAVVARVGRPLVARREPRVALFGTLLIAVGFLLTVLAPRTLLLVSPIVLGVPHVVSDLRYLVARPELHKRWPLWIVIGLPLAWCMVGGGMRAGILATAGALAFARGNRLVRALGIAACGALFAVASWAGWTADLVFAHAHNFVGVALWWVWRKRSGKLHWLPLAAFALGTTLLLLGVAEPDTSDYPWSIGDGLVPDALYEYGGRLVGLYAFAQAVHYTVWVRLIPEEDRERPTPRTFASSFRALVGDLGPWVVLAAALTFAGFAVYAFVDLVVARDTYLRFAIFHGHLELAAGALLLVERKLPLGATAAR